MRTRIRILALTAAIATAGSIAAPAGAHNEGLPSIPLSISEMELIYNRPQAGGNNLAFFERQHEDGTIGRYVVASTKVNGFDIYDVTDPGHVGVVGQFVLGGDPAADPQGAVENSFAGANYHPWVDVNPRRNIVALTIENPGGALRHGGGAGMAFVDISDIANPVFLGKVDGLGGPHTLRMIGDTHVYTSLDTWVVDYTDPTSPEAFRLAPQFRGHEYWEDPNSGLTFVGTETRGKWAIWDTSDPADPQVIAEVFDPALETAHEVYPAPDGSFVGVADFSAEGQLQTECPGGGIHFYDISGTYVPGASISTPEKMGVYYADYAGNRDASQDGPNSASCTMHSWAMNPERLIGLGGLYTGGTWVLDPTHVTTPEDNEYSGTHRGDTVETTRGKTLGNVRDALDFVNATQFFPFDMEDPEHNRYVVVTGWERGVDVYKYNGPMPKKLARLTLDAAASGGTVTGTLERYAVLTHEGWTNKPLAGQTVQVSAGGTTVNAVTGAGGGFSADLGLAAGSHDVTVSWAGDEVFAGETTTRTVSAS